MLNKLFTAAHTMDLDERKSVTRWAGVFAGAAVLVIVALAVDAARTSVGSDSARGGRSEVTGRVCRPN